MSTILDARYVDPLPQGQLRCAGRCPAPAPGRLVDGELHVDETLAERIRAALCDLAPWERPERIVLAPAEGVDPLGPDQYLQSSTFLSAAAALEAQVGVSIVARGIPARGFSPLFRRYPGMVTAHVAVSLPELEPSGGASWPSRLSAISAFSTAGVSTWLRLDPVVPTRTDSSDQLLSWLEPLAAAGATGVVVVPLVLDGSGQALIGDDPAVVDYYRPGRRRRGAAPAAPGPHMPLERETALVWRVRRIAQDLGLRVRLCRCARGIVGSCGLVMPGRARATTESEASRAQLSLWAG
jgi:hypothetical protein